MNKKEFTQQFLPWPKGASFDELLARFLKHRKNHLGFFIAEQYDGVCVFLDPVKVVNIWAEHTEIETGEEKKRFQSNNFIPLDEICLLYQSPSPPLPYFTFTISYEAISNFFRASGEFASFSYGLPLGSATRYRTTLFIPKDCSKILVQHLELQADEKAIWNTDVEKILNTDLEFSTDFKCQTTQTLEASTSESRYVSSVESVKNAIHVGEVYQANYTSRWDAPSSGYPDLEYIRLRARNFPRYGAFGTLELEDRSIGNFCCLSPELFFNIKDRVILTSPIKGTINREVKDAINVLSGSLKDKAELAMIVDLMRNDLGRICEIGSVQVSSHGRIDELPYVYHLVSDIRGVLLNEMTLSKILSAIFPAGSVTGAPKIAALKIISQLEDTPRGLYTGAIGWGNGAEMTCTVPIRTAMYFSDRTVIGSGSGITIDSDPTLEHREALAKLRAFDCFYKIS